MALYISLATPTSAASHIATKLYNCDNKWWKLESYTRGWHLMFAVLQSLSLVKVHGQVISLDLWLLLKLRLTFVQSLVNFCKITFTQLFVKVWIVDYTVTFDLPKSCLDFWLSLWPRTKIRVRDVLDPLVMYAPSCSRASRGGNLQNWIVKCPTPWDNAAIQIPHITSWGNQP